MLCLSNRHAVTRNDNNGACILHDERSIFRRALFNRTLRTTASCSARATTVPTESAKDYVEERTIHSFTHNVRKNRTGRTYKRTGYNQSAVV